MNYKKIYNSFISDRLNKESEITGYFERHHITPKSLGGGDGPDNIIKLTASDHFFAHLLLAKIHGGKMYLALMFMCNANSNSAKGFKAKRLQFETCKKNVSKFLKIRMKGSKNPFYGRAHEPETIRRMIDTRVQVKGSDHHEYNHEKVEYRNIKTGEILKCTRNDFCKKTGLNHRPVSAISNGVRKTHKNWYCPSFFSEKEISRESVIGINHYKTRKETYLFKHKDGMKFLGTRFEFYTSIEGVTESGARAICNKTNKTHKGWSIDNV